MLSKKDFARQYSVSRTWFNKNVNTNSALMSKLREAGYSVNQRTLNKKQRDIITDHLGEP
jgi:N-acetyl-anhydromuramyl-L-alanine amidase AmpD